MTDQRTEATRRSYDQISASYRERFEDELGAKTFDRRFLDAFAAAISESGWVIDLGSGPGQIGGYLSGQGLRILSLDLSRGMLRQSRALLPDSPRVQADMRALPFHRRSVAGVVAFFSLIHIPPAELKSTIEEMRRALMPGGHLAIATHVTPPANRVDASEALTDGALHVEQMLSMPVDLDFFFYGPDRLRPLLERTGFRIVRCAERDPYKPEIEAQTRRAYILAEKAA